ncbi:hypothetical protein F2P79_005180 [Pimephales promelas]|nr:hypothetical protein F2P79_005180 [Pimephales promelas]
MNYDEINTVSKDTTTGCSFWGALFSESRGLRSSEFSFLHDEEERNSYRVGTTRGAVFERKRWTTGM